MICECNRMLKSTSYTVDGGVFYIITNGTFTPSNRMAFSLILCQNIPVQTSVLPVSIQVNGVNYPLLDKFGNRVMITDLCTRRRFSLVFGSNPGHFLAFNICSDLNNVNLEAVAAAATQVSTSATQEVKTKVVNGKLVPVDGSGS